eukprot:TRINITY_DN6309_c0_g2_i3.p1 TRINITY_DN6309_c0_g2~~TRINITY_DN6309_c0_g2_i3.p1  ORF type:complete len:138 (-),score=26.25 TRINITY_DN6309_c0_g2_i3:75-488(-)
MCKKSLTKSRLIPLYVGQEMGVASKKTTPAKSQNERGRREMINKQPSLSVIIGVPQGGSLTIGLHGPLLALIFAIVLNVLLFNSEAFDLRGERSGRGQTTLGLLMMLFTSQNELFIVSLSFLLLASLLSYFLANRRS